MAEREKSNLMNVLEKILEEIENHAIEFESFGMCDDYVSVGWIKEIIRSHMLENDDWVPVEERLPDKGIYVMCCFDDGAVDVLWQNWKEDKSLLFYADIDGEIRKAIAWQPVPEPYKPKKDNSATEHIMSRFMTVE